MSETSRCRQRLAPFCAGFGVDVGYGGDPIRRSAICIDMKQPYTNVGMHPQHLAFKNGELPYLTNFFRFETLDYVYSSHLIEDFTYAQQLGILKDWMDVLRTGGRIVLYQPDQKRFEEHCARTGQPLNDAHKERDYSLQTFKDRVAWHINATVLHEVPAVEDYSWEMVLEKL